MESAHQLGSAADSSRRPSRHVGNTAYHSSGVRRALAASPDGARPTPSTDDWHTRSSSKTSCFTVEPARIRSGLEQVAVVIRYCMFVPRRSDGATEVAKVMPKVAPPSSTLRTSLVAGPARKSQKGPEVKYVVCRMHRDVQQVLSIRTIGTEQSNM